jgi:tRNA A37 threonylcarbamoyltransferase TsaD
VFPSPAYCTDNAVMIAGLGWHALSEGAWADGSLDASPR